MYEESRRRLAVLYRILGILGILVYFEPAEMCILQSDLIMALLPAKKQPWEACDASTWQEEVVRGPGVQSDYGLTATGDLVRMHPGQDYCGGGTRLLYEVAGGSSMASSSSSSPSSPSSSSSSSQNSPSAWEDWFSGMDGFGRLIMLAALVVASR